MNNNETEQLRTLTSTVSRLEKVAAALERRVIQLENQNKKMYSALSAAKQRISTLTSSLDSVRAQVNRH